MPAAFPPDRDSLRPFTEPDYDPPTLIDAAQCLLEISAGPDSRVHHVIIVGTDGERLVCYPPGNLLSRRQIRED